MRFLATNENVQSAKDYKFASTTPCSLFHRKIHLKQNRNIFLHHLCDEVIMQLGGNKQTHYLYYYYSEGILAFSRVVNEANRKM